MRRLSFLIFLMVVWLDSYCSIVINEVMYDAVGSDQGKEWIELYNNGQEDVNLQGWLLQAGGSSFTDILIFPSINIRAKSFFLISEQASPLTNYIAELHFENGGSTSDGIRILNPRDQYTDTILYDSPNNNNLVGDNGDYDCLCPAVTPGQSLARISDGIDTDCPEDWLATSQSSPGNSNEIVKIVEMTSCKALISTDNIEVSTIILNLSTFKVDKSDLSIKIIFNNELKYNSTLSEIPPLDSLNICLLIENENYQNGQLSIELVNNTNVDIVDNLWETLICYDIPDLQLSEIMHSPLTGNSEWIEVKLLEDIKDLQVRLSDSAGNYAPAVISGYAGDYLVIAQDKNKLLETFSVSDSSLVMQPTTWPRLNNNGDKINLEIYNTRIDSLIYGPNSTSKGYSLEYHETSQQWSQCTFPTRASPTKENSLPTPNHDIKINNIQVANSLISRKQDKLLRIDFASEDENCFLSLKIFDIRGKEITVIKSDIAGKYGGQLAWNGYLQGKYLASGLYPAVIRLNSENGRLIAEKKTLITINR